MIRSLVTYAVVLFLGLLISPSLTHASLFTDSCGDGIGNTRPLCKEIVIGEDIPEFNPNAYTQVPLEKDCSNYCFDTESGFASKEIIRQTTVTCGDPLIAYFNRLGDALDYEFPDPEINGDASVGLGSITSLSMDDENRSNAGVWWRLINELGSVWTNMRGRQDAPMSMLDFGKNVVSRPFELQLDDRLKYCGNLLMCQSDNYADLSDLKDQRIPEFRCVNPQPYDAYPWDEREEIVSELDTCQQANAILTPYDTKDRNLSDYFMPCTKANSVYCNPEYDPVFARRFLALEPALKARELMVVCTDQVTAKTDGVVAMGTRVDQTKLDCQEIVISPGLVAACQGIWRQYEISTPRLFRDAMTPQLEPSLKELVSLNGPVVKYNPAWWEHLYTPPQIQRFRQYARRINAEEDPNLCTMAEQDAETYGDANPDILTSPPNAAPADSIITEPNAEGETYTNVKRTFVIAPPGFDQCFNILAHQADVALSKTLSSYNNELINNESSKEIDLPTPHGSSITNPAPSEENCEYLLPDGSWSPEPPGPDATKRCQQWSLEFDDNDSEVRIHTSGGNVTRFFFLNFLKGDYTSAYASDWAANRICDWFAFVRGRAAEYGCLSDFGPDNPIFQQGNGENCKEGTGLCSPDTLIEYFKNTSNPALYARVASHICRRESGGGPFQINDSCRQCLDGIDNDLDGNADFDADNDCDSNDYNYREIPGATTADYSVGLFQHNIHPKGIGCPGAWEDTPAGATDLEEFIYCGIADQAALDECIAKYEDPVYNTQRMVERACGADMAGPCSFGPWYTDLSCNFVTNNN